MVSALRFVHYYLEADISLIESIRHAIFELACRAGDNDLDSSELSYAAPAKIQQKAIKKFELMQETS